LLTKKAKYGLKALLALARLYGQVDVVGIAEIADKERIPLKFLEAILLELKSGGWLFSRRGRLGGYALALPPDQINLGAVLRELGGPFAPVPCVSKHAYEPCEECVDQENCGIRAVMKQARDAMAEVLDSTTLADVLEKEREPLPVPSNEYFI
jgi:Rrf2 family protein